MKRAALILVSAVLCSGLAFWWSKSGGAVRGAAHAPAPAHAEVSTLAPPRTQSAIKDVAPEAGAPLFFDPVVVSPCTLVPVQEQDVSSQVDGAVHEIQVQLGAEVVPGQLLARLDDSQLRPQVELLRLKAESESAVRIARAQFEEADLKVRYAERANSSGVRSVPSLEYKTYQLQRERYEQEMKRAHEEREVAAKELEKAEKLLQQHEIRSAIHGVVLKVYKRTGEAVKQAEPLFRVANYRRLRAEGLCKVQQGSLLKVGMPALVEPEVRGEQLTELAGHTEAITALAVSPAGSLLASASEDRTALVWDWARGKRLAMLPHPAEVYALAFVPPQGSEPLRLLTGSADGQLRLWTLETGTPGDPRIFTAGGAIRAIALSPDGKWCATGGDDRRIVVWDLAAGKALYQVAAEEGFSAHQGAVTSLHFTADGHLVSAGRDNTLKVWRLGPDGGRLVLVQAGRTGEVGELGVSPDGRRVLFDHGDELRILERTSGTTLGALRSRRQGRFHGLARFSPSGRLVLTASNNSRLQLWKAPAPPEEVAFFRSSHAAGLEPRAFTAWLALGSAAPLTLPALLTEERLPRLWDVAGRELHHFLLPGAATVRCGAFGADEKVCFTGGTDKVVRVWALPTAAEWGRALEARITFLGGQIERGTDTIRVRAELDNPHDFALRPGGQVSLKLYPETAR